MNYTIEIDHHLKIIRYKHVGVVGKEEIGQAWQELLKLEEFTKQNFNLLSDYREAEFKFDIEDIGLISKHLSAFTPILKGKKQSLIINDPESTAMSMIFESEVYDEIGFMVKVFSTINGALKWLVI